MNNNNTAISLPMLCVFRRPYNPAEIYYTVDLTLPDKLFENRLINETILQLLYLNTYLTNQIFNRENI